MNVLKRLSAGITALIMTAGTLASGMAIPMTAVAADDNNDDWIHAVGSRLYDANGNEVWITGANWFGFNCGERFPHGLWSADVDELLSAVADRGINTLRLPIATELLLDWMDGVDDSSMISINPKNDDGYKFNPDFCRPDGSCMSSHEIFDVILQKCKKYGLKVFIDIHSPALHNSGHNYNLWYYNEGAGSYDSMAVTKEGAGIPVTTEMWHDSLVWLADQYKNDDTLIAYDLKNEPHGKCQEGDAGAKWDDSTDENNWKYAAETCAKDMLAKNPNAMILVEGIEQYPREGHKWGDPDSRTDPPAYPGWWGGQFRGVRDYPIDLGEYQNKLIYSPHDYGPGVYNQTWFAGDFTEETLLKDYWYDTWAFLNEEDIAPLLIGEWGGFMDGGKNEQWLNILREYMIKNHINHTFWCLNPNSGDTGGLLDYSFKNWDEDKYNVMEPALWQTSKTGKYIGLDHKTALGKNGLSVTEYYASYHDSEGSNLDNGGKTDPLPPTTDLPQEQPTTKPTEKPTVKPTEPESAAVSEMPTENITVLGSETMPAGTDLPVNFTYGDVNCDTEVTVVDAIMLAKALLGSAELSPEGRLAADVDLDGKTTSDDLSFVVKSLAQIMTLPVA